MSESWFGAWVLFVFLPSLAFVGYECGWRGWVGVLVGLNMAIGFYLHSKHEEKEKQEAAAARQAARDNDEYRLFE